MWVWMDVDVLYCMPYAMCKQIIDEEPEGGMEQEKRVIPRLTDVPNRLASTQKGPLGWYVSVVKRP